MNLVNAVKRLLGHKEGQMRHTNVHPGEISLDLGASLLADILDRYGGQKALDESIRQIAYAKRAGKPGTSVPERLTRRILSDICESGNYDAVIDHYKELMAEYNIKVIEGVEPVPFHEYAGCVLWLAEEEAEIQEWEAGQQKVNSVLAQEAEMLPESLEKVIAEKKQQIAEDFEKAQKTLSVRVDQAIERVKKGDYSTKEPAALQKFHEERAKRRAEKLAKRPRVAQPSDLVVFVKPDGEKELLGFNTPSSRAAAGSLKHRFPKGQTIFQPTDNLKLVLCWSGKSEGKKTLGPVNIENISLLMTKMLDASKAGFKTTFELV